jgi:shikimate kinase
LAKRFAVDFVDSDDAIEQQLGCSIRQYFELFGEEQFRSIEMKVIAGLAATQRGVVATGGGAVLREDNRNALRQNFHVFYLRAHPEDISRRLRHDKVRPLLQVADPLGRLRELFSVRDPLYAATAHYVIETGRPTLATLVNMIQMQIELANGATAGAGGSE